MKIKLQDYCLVSNDFIKALNDYGIPKHFIETIPAEKLADVCFDKGALSEALVNPDDYKKRFLNSEIEVQ
jgi:hypothetical protein